LRIQLSDEELLFTFKDRSMPEFILTQPEVYEGDTILEAMPTFLHGVAYIFGGAFALGLLMYLVNPTRVHYL
jgi:thioredoxin-related protein